MEYDATLPRDAQLPGLLHPSTLGLRSSAARLVGRLSRRQRLLWLIAPLATALVASITGIIVAVSIDRPQVDDIEAFQPDVRSQLFDHREHPYAKLATEDRILLAPDEVPPLLAQAIISTEDARFDSHGGIDLKGIVRAVIVNILHPNRREGASTLTMQLARNRFQLGFDQAMWRKIEESFLAVELEKNYSKQQILAMYVNTVNMGSGNYGMEAASRAYFGKSVDELGVVEAATLAGIPKRPKNNPYRRPEWVLARRNKVLERMHATGVIDDITYRSAVVEPLGVLPRQPSSQPAPYFTEQVRRDLVERFGATRVYRRGLNTVTTLDPHIQRDAEAALAAQLQRLDPRLKAIGDDDKVTSPAVAPESHVQGAVVVIESATGAVRAMVGGYDFETSELNRAVQSRRQVGSAFKLFVYGAALESGFTPADTLFDGPVAFPGAGATLTYSPRNNSRRYSGKVTLRRALEKSLNVPAVKMLDLVGIDRVIDFARRCGIASDLPPYPSLALGAADLQPLELAAAYAAVAYGGVWQQPYWIETVADSTGRVLYERPHQPSRAMSEQTAHLLREMLRGVTQRGSASRLRTLPLDIAGKTGTTNGSSDGWFVGFTPRYTLLVWIGHDRHQADRRVAGRRVAHRTGSAAALGAWHELATRGLDAGWLQSGERFPPPPAGITTATIDARSGLLAGTNPNHQTLVEHFRHGTAPRKRISDDRRRVLDLPWYQQEPFYVAKEGERMPADVDDWSVVTARWARR